MQNSLEKSTFYTKLSNLACHETRIQYYLSKLSDFVDLISEVLSKSLIFSSDNSVLLVKTPTQFLAFWVLWQQTNEGCFLQNVDFWQIFTFE